MKSVYHKANYTNSTLILETTGNFSHSFFNFFSVTFSYCIISHRPYGQWYSLNVLLRNPLCQSVNLIIVHYCNNRINNTSTYAILKRSKHLYICNRTSLLFDGSWFLSGTSSDNKSERRKMYMVVL